MPTTRNKNKKAQNQSLYATTHPISVTIGGSNPSDSNEDTIETSNRGKAQPSPQERTVFDSPLPTNNQENVEVNTDLQEPTNESNSSPNRQPLDHSSTTQSPTNEGSLTSPHNHDDNSFQVGFSNNNGGDNPYFSEEEQDLNDDERLENAQNEIELLRKAYVKERRRVYTKHNLSNQGTLDNRHSHESSTSYSSSHRTGYSNQNQNQNRNGFSQRPSQRLRTQGNPYKVSYRQDAQVGHVLPSDFRKVTIADLLKDEFEQENDTYINLQLIRVVSAVNEGGKAGQSGSYSFYAKKDKALKKNGSYTRMFLCREHESTRTCYIIEDSNGKHYWGKQVHLRDSGELTIGSVFLVVAPEELTTFIGNDTPILKSRSPVILMKLPTLYKTVPIDQDTTSNKTKAFTLNNVELKITFLQFEKSCSGFFCDRQDILNFQKREKKCGCYLMNKRTADAVTMVNMTGTVDGIKAFTHKGFSSLQFMNLFLDGRLPNALELKDLQGFQKTFDFFSQVKACVKSINENDGFTVFGWYKRGEVTDLGSNEDSNIEASSIVHHVVHIIPTNPNHDFSHLKIVADNL